MKFKSLVSASLVSLGLVSGNTLAVQAGDMFVRAGASNVALDVNSSGFTGASTVSADVDDNTQPSLTLTYMLQNNIGVELLLATPFSHDVAAAGAVTGKVGETKQLPPTLSVQYHFKPQSKFRPYAGLGINFTNFFDTKATSVITSLDLDDSWGMAAQVGMDYAVDKNWFINVDLRYINIETKGYTDIGTVDVELNPTVFTVAAGFNF